MEDEAQLREQIDPEHISARAKGSSFKSPSKIHVAKVILKLLPIVINFRQDRRIWVKHEGKNIDESKFRKHAKKALKTFIELGPSYIKLGQWLSSRADLLPLPYLEELSKTGPDSWRPEVEMALAKIRGDRQTIRKKGSRS